MKKKILGSIVAVGIAVVIYADCIDKVVNIGTNDAENNPGCSGGGTLGPCTYHTFSPAIPDCRPDTNVVDQICTSTNILTYRTYSVTNGACSFGTCHLGTRDSSSCTTNTVPDYFTITCGG